MLHRCFFQQTSHSAFGHAHPTAAERHNTLSVNATLAVQGEGAAIINTLNTMIGCLERGGCVVVPGIPENQYQLTLLTSFVGGCIFGYATTIKPQGLTHIVLPSNFLQLLR